MSKAFVKDDAADDLDELESADAAAQPASGAPNYITRAGYERLKAELLHLIDAERPEVVRVVSWAASNGDRSENGDYIYGKKRLREIDRRIRFLTRRLDAAEVVDAGAPGKSRPGVLRCHGDAICATASARRRCASSASTRSIPRADA